MNQTRYERVTLDDGKRILLRNPHLITVKVLGTVLVGVQVNKEGDTADIERTHVIQIERIKSRRDMVMSLHYGTLEAASTANRRG